jgi:hypothetical protein
MNALQEERLLDVHRACTRNRNRLRNSSGEETEHALRMDGGIARPHPPRSGDLRLAGELRSKMAAPQAYCVKCKSKHEIKDAAQITMKNGRPATEGKCSVCGTKMFKIGAA